MGGGQHPAPEGRKIGTPPPLWMFLTASLTSKKIVSRTKSPMSKSLGQNLLNIVLLLYRMEDDEVCGCGGCTGDTGQNSP